VRRGGLHRGRCGARAQLLRDCSPPRLGLDGFDCAARTEDLGELRPDDTVLGDGEGWDESVLAGAK
jgi:hypothetical protein